MTLEKAKTRARVTAYAAAQLTDAMNRDTNPDLTVDTAKALVQTANALACAAREIEARLLGVPEPTVG